MYRRNPIAIYDQAGKHRAPIGMLSNGVSGPRGMYVYRGDLYVANHGSADVIVFHKHETRPYETLTLPSGVVPFAVTVDPRGTV